jgi:hypothetical protein
MKTMSRGLMLLGLLALLAQGSGCAAKRLNLTVEMDKSMTEAGGVPSMEVDLVGIQEGELQKWNEYSMNAYWDPNDPNQMRRSAEDYTHHLRFGPDLPMVQVLNSKDAKWDSWAKRKAEYLLVLMDLPRTHDDKKGEADPRRKVLPLGEFKTDQVKVTIRPSGAIVQPPPGS